jgi:hypothetical protein
VPVDHVHFNGSVNLGDAELVMREIASRVPSGLRRIPDGETGDRGNWIFFQLQKFLQLPWLVLDRPAEQAAGTTGDQVSLIDAALAASPGGRRDWGICTECGMGRVDRDEIPALLDLHREIIVAR